VYDRANLRERHSMVTVAPHHRDMLMR
jgi:hypothetical protein